MFSCKFCEIFNNTLFTEHLRTTASAIYQVNIYLMTKENTCSRDSFLIKLQVSGLQLY